METETEEKGLINSDDPHNQSLDGTDMMVLESATDTNIHDDLHGFLGIGYSCSSFASRPIPPFLLKTFDMLSNEETNSFVSWNPNGTSFVIKDPHSFAANVLPMYFRHNNFQSFVTQLNSYGFRKISWEQWEYRNEYFRKGEKHLLRNIKRRNQILHTRHPDFVMEPSFDTSSGSSNKECEINLLKTEMEKLKEKQQALQEKLTSLKYQVVSNEREQSRMMGAAQRILRNLRDLSNARVMPMVDDGRELTESKGKSKLEETTCCDVLKAGIVVQGEDMEKHPVNTFISFEDLIGESSDCPEYIKELQEKASQS